MAGKLLFQICYFSCVILFGGIQMIKTTPLFSFPMSDSRSVNNRMVVTDLDKLDAVLEAVMEEGGNIVYLFPQKDVEKRDPIGPDLGTGRSYTGHRTAKVMWGQLASNSPTGPGRRKRNSTDGRSAATYLLDGGGRRGEFRFIEDPNKEVFPRFNP